MKWSITLGKVWRQLLHVNVNVTHRHVISAVFDNISTFHVENCKNGSWASKNKLV